MCLVFRLFVFQKLSSLHTFFDLSADKMFDIPVFPRSTMICFRPNLLFLVGIIRSPMISKRAYYVYDNFFFTE